MVRSLAVISPFNLGGRLRHGSDPCADRRLGAQRLLVLAVVALDRVDLRDE